MDIVRKIIACETIDELTLLENLYVLNELVYERKVEIVMRLLEWGMENERHGLAANLSDSWTPEQRRNFLDEWNDDEPFRMILNEEALQHSSDKLQSGRGKKRSFDESATDEVSENNYFTVTNVKKFKTTGTDYTVRFTNTFANMELSQYHDQLHEIFDSLLDTVIGDVPENDQVFVVQTKPVGQYSLHSRAILAY